jgi:hypothetical protein
MTERSFSRDISPKESAKTQPPERSDPSVSGRTFAGHDVFSLQRQVGNRAVGRLLKGNTSRGVLQRKDEPAAPQIQSWGMTVTPGGQGAGLPRDITSTVSKIFVGDKARISAEFGPMTPEQRSKFSY